MSKSKAVGRLKRIVNKLDTVTRPTRRGVGNDVLYRCSHDLLLAATHMTYMRAATNSSRWDARIAALISLSYAQSSLFNTAMIEGWAQRRRYLLQARKRVQQALDELRQA